MNKLVEHLAVHHHPSGNAYKVVPVITILEESGFTVEEIHHMAMEAYKDKYLVFSRLRVRGNRWGVNAMIPGDIDYMAVTREGIEWYNLTIKLKKTPRLDKQ